MSAKTKATAAEAASLKRLIEGYDRPGARERGLQILAREMDAATEIKKLGPPLGLAYVGMRGAFGWIRLFARRTRKDRAPP